MWQEIDILENVIECEVEVRKHERRDRCGHVGLHLGVADGTQGEHGNRPGRRLNELILTHPNPCVERPLDQEIVAACTRSQNLHDEIRRGLDIGFPEYAPPIA